MSIIDRGGLRLEDYLTTIYRLEEALGEARITDIAHELSVTPATASKIIGKLEKKGFVKRIRYRNVRLTQPGREIAERIIRKHRIAEVFLSKLLRFSDLDSHHYAHFLEHLPDIVIERIYEYIGRPVLCPHGNLIPGSVVEGMVELYSMLNVDLGVSYTLIRVAGEFTKVLEF
ncbi:MAG: metal-dependent transcriptional regulator, partial [Desulfurococcaceae archaeon]